MHDHPDQPSPYQSPVVFDPQHVQAAAVYCSDGRFGDQVDDLLHNGLQLPRYDRLVVPGGGGCLAGHFAARREEEAAFSQLRFLIEAHRLQRVVLIAHEDCGFYSELLHISQLQMETSQREDLEKAVSRVRGVAHGLTVVAYFARKQGDRVCFEPWDL
ncbi:MAG: carbonic anhydrase [Planctomycetota bacterium]|jgi:hypothetical protein